MYSKRRQPRKQKKSRSGLRKTQRGGMIGKLIERASSGIDDAKAAVSGTVSSARADLQTHQELPSRVDGLQATVAELQKQVADLKDNTATNFKKVLYLLRFSSQTDDYNNTLDNFKQRIVNQLKTITIM